MKPSFIIIPLLILSLSLLSDWYVLQGVKTIASRWSSPGIAKLLRTIYISLSTMILAGLFAGILSMSGKEAFTLLFRIFLNAFLVWTAARLVFILALSAEDLTRLIRGLVLLIQHKTFVLPPRHMAVSISAATLMLATILIFIHGIVVNKHNYKIRYETVIYPDLPESFDGITIVQISDFHAGSLTNIEAVQAGIEKIKALQPDILVFTGDMVNNLADEFAPFVDLFSAINPPLGKYAVLGNHDYGDYVPWKREEDKQKNLAKLIAFEEQAGFNVLLNEAVPVVLNSDTLYVAGVENWGHNFVKKGNLRQALQQLSPSDFIILLSHDPSHWDAEVKNHEYNIALTLSGHTHGFQFGIEIGKFKWSPVQLMYKSWAGLDEHRGRHRYINRGFGYIAFEGRVGIRPEITVIELKKQ